MKIVNKIILLFAVGFLSLMPVMAAQYEYFKVVNDPSQLLGEHTVMIVWWCSNTAPYPAMASTSGYVTTSSNSDMTSTTITCTAGTNVWPTTVNATRPFYDMFKLDVSNTTVRQYLWYMDGKYAKNGNSIITKFQNMYWCLNGAKPSSYLGAYHYSSAYNNQYLHPAETNVSYIRTWMINEPAHSDGSSIECVQDVADLLPGTTVQTSYKAYKYWHSQDNVWLNNSVDAAAASRNKYYIYVQCDVKVSFSCPSYATITSPYTGDGFFLEPTNITLPAAPTLNSSSYSSKVSFRGWGYINGTDTTILGNPGDVVLCDGRTIQAIYRLIDPCTVTFRVGSHGICDTLVYKGFLPINLPVVEPEDGFDFIGWTSSALPGAPKASGTRYPATGDFISSDDDITFDANYNEVFRVLGWKMARTDFTNASYYTTSYPDTLIIQYTNKLPHLNVIMIDTAGGQTTLYTSNPGYPVQKTYTSGTVWNVDTCIYKVPITASYVYSGKYKGARMCLQFLNASKIEMQRGYLRMPHIFYPTSASDAGTYIIPTVVYPPTKASAGNTFRESWLYNSDIIIEPSGTGVHVTMPKGNYTCRNLYVYGGARLDIPKGSTLNVRGSVYLRGGDVVGSRSVESGQYRMQYSYRYPQLVVNGTLNLLNAGKVYYDMICDTTAWYNFCVPYDVATSDVIFWNGDSAKIGRNYYLQDYNGTKRALFTDTWVNQDSTAWFTDSVSTRIIGGKGYTITAKAGLVKPASTGKLGQYQRYALLRFPILASSLPKGEVTRTRSVPVAPYPSSTKTIHAGWNLVGNPYMGAFGGQEPPVKYYTTGQSAYNYLGYETNGMNITNSGSAVDQLAYVVIPSNDGNSYTSYVASAYMLPAFKNFFIQVGAPSADSLAYSLRNQRAAKPAYMTGENDSYRFGLTLTTADAAITDRVGFLIGDDYTDEYEINADLAKWENTRVNLFACSGTDDLSFIAVNNERAETKIPLGLKLNARYNNMVIALDPSYDMSDLEHVYLYDDDEEVTTDLMQKSYTLSSTKCNNRSRLSLRVVRKAQTPTAVEEIRTATYPNAVKYIENGRLLIQYTGRIFDAQGQLIK